MALGEALAAPASVSAAAAYDQGQQGQPRSRGCQPHTPHPWPPLRRLQHIVDNPGPLMERVEAAFSKVAHGDYSDVLWATRQAVL